jgi:non-ribosomal peptide synthetase component F
LSPVEWQYADWSECQRGRLAGAGLRELQAFWAAELAGAGVTCPPGMRPGDRLGERGFVQRSLGAADAAALRAVAVAHATTPYTVGLAAFAWQLATLAGTGDVAVATLADGRERPEVRATTGFFVNLLLQRIAVADSAGFGDLVASLAAARAPAARHAELPFQMPPPGVLADGRADDVVFQLIDGDPRPEVRLDAPGLDAAPFERRSSRSRFALELFVVCEADAVTATVVHDRGRVPGALARALADGYVRLLAAACAEPALTPAAAA